MLFVTVTELAFSMQFCDLWYLILCLSQCTFDASYVTVWFISLSAFVHLGHSIENDVQMINHETKCTIHELETFEASRNRVLPAPLRISLRLRRKIPPTLCPHVMAPCSAPLLRTLLHRINWVSHRPTDGIHRRSCVSTEGKTCMLSIIVDILGMDPVFGVIQGLLARAVEEIWPGWSKQWRSLDWINELWERSSSLVMTAAITIYLRTLPPSTECCSAWHNSTTYNWMLLDSGPVHSTWP